MTRREYERNKLRQNRAEYVSFIKTCVCMTLVIVISTWGYFTMPTENNDRVECKYCGHETFRGHAKDHIAYHYGMDQVDLYEIYGQAVIDSYDIVELAH